ncbi:MAG: RluA family pseudouridine synthase [Puniceicoccales bacterium]|jgi:23S rRNA pseudouridine1911/1915/1917 synthase|nr:RluA family pseudouridine synthase [Puniceicoccales bacterium]
MMVGDEQTIVVQDSGKGKRIDKFLSENFQDVSRTQLKKSFDGGLVSIKGVPMPAKYILHGQELITLRLILPNDVTLHPVSMPLDILFEDEDIIVVNKPAGIVVHAGNGTSAPTLVEGILSHCRLSGSGNPLRPGVVHRLDKDTSGAIIFTKTDRAYLQLVKMFATRKIKKTYQTIVCETFAKSFGEICLPVQRNRFVRTKMAVSVNGKEAISRWHILKSFGQQFTHLQVNILTGRTHQIRVHMAAIGHPILGDTTYGYDKNFSKLVTSTRVMLHASEVAFNHPCTGETISIKTRLPLDFAQVLQLLSGKIS